MSHTDAYKALVRQWLVFLVLGAGLLFVFRTQAGGWWTGPYGDRWLMLALLGHVYFSVVLFRNLKTNHRAGETALLPDLGWANWLTLLRATLMATVVGFLFSPMPVGSAAWLPGLLYTAASVPDFIDGIVARKTNHVTALGEILDMNVDSVGVFTATFLAFQYGVIPWWYLPVGLARYIFVAGIRIREKQGKPVKELPFSHRRRAFAALKMGFMFVMLFPLFTPPGTFVAAAAFGLPFIGGFIWDWLQVIGSVTPAKRIEIKARLSGLLSIVPLILRGICVVFALPYIGTHLADPALLGLGAAEMAVTILIAFGIAPRASAIAAVCLVGVNQNLAPLQIDQYLLAVAYIETIFLGTGILSLWPIENKLIYYRFGDAA